ncbi:hypothetical protein RBH26_08990 [Natronolimnohabitans sp. A-GB9]|uniref:DUF7553 family protein n=1 Tax=Natronolimnohabitans sp. A-GB9 TaxID=3069757 RepID=UPI0027AF484E|nr:hypothetical protein [Natronolimnohabitans sp. A-GB9]MDQ2050622.1 hypothetical protein [Natronolimnohabitans sp. A-GB9]
MTDDAGHEPAEHLKRVRERLQRATASADRSVQTQLNSITAGVFEEQEGDLTQSEPGPKVDRIAEVAEKLDGLADEASGETTDHVRTARDHCLEYVAESDDDERSRDAETE